MSQNNVDVVEVVQKIRRKRCLICICCPNLWVIDSYIRQHRINGLIYIHDSGKFVYFDEDGAKIISELGKNTRSFKGLNYPEGHYFFGSNIPQMPDSVAEKYLEKKDEDLNMLLGRLATSAEGKIDKEYIGVMEAASVLGVSENLVRKEVDEGRIKSIRVGKRILIKANFIEEMGLEGVSRRTLLQKESGPEKKPKLNYNTPIVNVEDGVSFLAEQPQPSTSEGREQ
jgi:excisionase family DNA binding protein